MTSKITRRTALSSTLAIGAAACAPETASEAPAAQAIDASFTHGVASGDPAHQGVVIWTRAKPAQGADKLAVIWEIAVDEGFSELVAKGETQTGPARDWTAKAEVLDLQPGSQYFYRFRVGEVYSPVGRTRTLPEGAVEKARFAVISCSNFPFGHFNVYKEIAAIDELDAVLHLGDYFYEYGREGYGGEAGAALGREHEPAHETVSLEDYRMRFAQYRSDANLQAVHARHAMIPIWDDHETANNSWKDGAQNHQPDSEGDWHTRRLAALQAYYEWMPVREPAANPNDFFRAFSYGDLLTISAIETRLMARAEEFHYADIVPTLTSPEAIEEFRNVTLWDPSRELLGETQRGYLADAFRKGKEAGQPWRLIANQIIMARVNSPDLTPHISEEEIVALEQQWDQARAFVQFSSLGLPTNLDAWDGYPAARERFYDLCKETADQAMIVVTGDTHTWWANNLESKDGSQMGVELGTSSVTSPSPYGDNFIGGRGGEYAQLTTFMNKDVRYLSGETHGFIDLTIERDSARAVFRAVDTITSTDYSAVEQASFNIERKDGAARFAG